MRLTLWPFQRLWPSRRLSWTVRLGRQTPIESLWTPYLASEGERDTSRTWSWRQLQYITVRHWAPSSGDWLVQTKPWSGAHAAISERVVLRSSIAGQVTLLEGSALQVDGAVVGDITIDEHASLVINGYVHGTIINNAGHVLVRGVLSGKILGDGYAVVEPGAQVPRKTAAS